MSHDTTTPRLLLVVADGVRPDVLREEIDSGHAPALAAIVARGGFHEVSASFPSVTGPAYVPFLMGRHPARVGLPGLRWYDRARTLRWAPAQSRSYAGIDIWHVDRDVAPDAPTLFELARPSLAAMSMLGRGATHGRIGRSIGWMLRGAPAHFRGDMQGWLDVERAATAQFLRRFARVRPRASVLAIASADKFAHKLGCHSDAVRIAIRDIDAAVASARAIATRDGWGDALHVWVVGDHGHAPVEHHDDLHGWLEREGHRVLAHPQLRARRADVALMVGGNAMAHLYLEPQQRTRHWWPTLAPQWERVAERLLARDSIDLLCVARDATTVEVRHAARGRALLTMTGDHARARWSYTPIDGDALALGGAHRDLDATAAWDACADTIYPDAIVQVSILATAPRSGDIIVSAAADWDLRARFEPVDHVSTHGALLRDQMMVPLLLDTPTRARPRRTADVVPSALDVLHLPADAPFDGDSFLRDPVR